jgi:hypothetical protein
MVKALRHHARPWPVTAAPGWPPSPNSPSTSRPGIRHGGDRYPWQRGCAISCGCTYHTIVVRQSVISSSEGRRRGLLRLRSCGTLQAGAREVQRWPRAGASLTRACVSEPLRAPPPCRPSPMLALLPERVYWQERPHTRRRCGSEGRPWKQGVTRGTEEPAPKRVWRTTHMAWLEERMRP